MEVMVRYGELSTKGKNKKKFYNKLVYKENAMIWATYI